MKNDIFSFLQTKIAIQIKGKQAERLINKAIREGIHFFEMKRKEESIITEIHVKDLSQLRKLRRQFDCQITVHKRVGFVFYLQRLKKYHGFTIGFILAVGIIFFLSNIVWGTKIDGATPKTEYEIQKRLKEYGLERGKPIFLLKSADEIQQMLYEDVPNLTWVGIEKRGTVYYFQVVEEVRQEKEEPLLPQNIVASKEAVITKMYIEKGKPLVVINDHVQKGEILVSGIIGNENNAKLVAAEGVVYGETWYITNVEVPLKTNFTVMNGENEKKYRFNIGQLSIPIWGFKVDEKKKDAVLQENEHPLYIFDYKLPFSFQTNTVYDTEEITREYTESEAIEVGKEMARKDVEKKLDKYGKILGERMIDIKTEEDKISITFHIQAQENIASFEPITAHKQEPKE